MTDEVIFRDFTVKRKPVAFGISGVRYRCVEALGTETLQELVNVYRNSNLQEAVKEHDADKIMASVHQIFKIFMLEDSYGDFIMKLKDKRDPVDIRQLMEIVAWIVEVYTKRPLEQSSTSSPTSETDDAGTSSEGGASSADEILSSSTR